MQQHDRACDCQHNHTDPLPVCGTQPAAEQPHLLLALEIQHPQLPLIVNVIPGQARFIEPGYIAVPRAGKKGVLQEATFASYCFFQAHFYPLGCYLEGWINRNPATPLQPNLYPGVGVKLMYQNIAPARIDLAALIARNNPRRYTRSAQNKGHGARVVFTEAAASIEEKLVVTVLPQWGRVERVKEWLLIEITKQRLHQLRIVGMLLAELLGPLARTRITLFGQRQLSITLQLAQLLRL